MHGVLHTIWALKANSLTSPSIVTVTVTVTDYIELISVCAK